MKLFKEDGTNNFWVEADGKWYRYEPFSQERHDANEQEFKETGTRPLRFDEWYQMGGPPMAVSDDGSIESSLSKIPPVEFTTATGKDLFSSLKGDVGLDVQFSDVNS